MNALSPMPEAPATRTTCPYCGVGCGVIATPDGTGGAAIAGDPEHPANFGRLCSKGSALGETLGLDDAAAASDDATARQPCATSTGTPRSTTSRTASRASVATHGPDAVAFYLSGQLLTEDYYVANKLMKGFIGTRAMSTPIRGCAWPRPSPAIAAPSAPTPCRGCYEDLDAGRPPRAGRLQRRLVPSGAVPAHAGRAREARRRAVVVIDPRRTATGEDADLHLPISARHRYACCSAACWSSGRARRDRPRFHRRAHGGLRGGAGARAEHRAGRRGRSARATGLDGADIARSIDLVAARRSASSPATRRASTSRRRAPTRSTPSSTATSPPGASASRARARSRSPASPTPWAGARSAGSPTMLAAHMGFSRAERRPRAPLLERAQHGVAARASRPCRCSSAIARGEHQGAVGDGHQPGGVACRAPTRCARRMRRLELLVVSENVRSQRHRRARRACAAARRRVGREGRHGHQLRAAHLAPARVPAAARRGAARLVDRVRKSRGGWASARLRLSLGRPTIFREHARAVRLRERRQRATSTSRGLADLSDAAYDALAPVQWPVRRGDETGAERAVRRRRLLHARPAGALRRASSAPRSPAEARASRPFVLNTGRMRDQWHTMTRTGALAAARRASPGARSSRCTPTTRPRFGLGRWTGWRGSRRRTARPCCASRSTTGSERASVFAPIHWSDETASVRRVGALVHPATDPHSGQPDAKATPVTVSPVAGEAGGFILSRKRLRLPGVAFWAWCAVEGGFATHLDGPFDPGPVLAALRSSVPGSDVARYRDEAADVTRAALLLEDRLEAVFFSGAGAPGGWTGLMRLWAAEKLSALDRLLILSGESGEGVPQTGPIVCACFGVGETAINEAIATWRIRYRRYRAHAESGHELRIVPA